jgi:hypothetical protein
LALEGGFQEKFKADGAGRKIVETYCVVRIYKSFFVSAHFPLASLVLLLQLCSGEFINKFIKNN